MDARDENKALVRKFYAEIDAGNLEAMDELVAPDFVDHDPFPGVTPDRDPNSALADISRAPANR